MKTINTNAIIDWLSDYKVYAQNRDSRIFEPFSDKVGLTVAIFRDIDENEMANRLGDRSRNGYEYEYALYDMGLHLVGFAYYPIYWVRLETLNDEGDPAESTDLLNTDVYDYALDYAKSYIEQNKLDDNQQVIIQDEDEPEGVLWASK